jgi:hypothetical protein
MDDPLRPALPEGHVQRGQHQLGPQMRGHRPADHPPAPGIEHDREVEKPGPGGHVGDVRDPEPVGAVGREGRLHEVGSRPGVGIARRGGDPLAATHALHAGRPHEPGHPLAADVDPLGRQLGMHPGRSVRPPGLEVDGVDRHRQLGVALRPRRRSAVLPRIVPAGGDPQHPAHGGDAIGGPVTFHEFESRDGIDVVSLANQAAAFLKISRSSRSTRALSTRPTPPDVLNMITGTDS